MTTPFTLTPETAAAAPNYSFNNSSASLMPHTPNSLNTTSNLLMHSNSTPNVTNEYNNHYVKNLNFNESPLNTKVQSSSHVYSSSTMNNNNLDEINTLSYNNNDYSNEHVWKSSNQQNVTSSTAAFYLY